VWGTNITAVPYPKCDLYTTTASGPYQIAPTIAVPYLIIYGIQLIPGGSVVNV
jgi:hypothetical protein